MKTNYALIGCGYVSKRHAEAILSLEKAELRVLCDKDLSQARGLLDKLNNSTVGIETNYESLLKRKDIDAVVLCLPTFLHEVVTVSFAQAGKHVFMEKPIAGSLKEAQTMIDVCAKNNVKLCVGHSHRYFPAIQKAREIVQGGKLGRVHKARALNCYFWDISTEKRLWKLDSVREIGGLLDTGIHYADDLRYILGKEVKSVFAKSRTVRKDIGQQKDDGLAFLEFEDNVNAVWEVSECQWSGKGPIPEAEGIEVYGTKGSLIVSLSGNLKAFYVKDGKEITVEETYSPDRKDIWTRIHRDFLEGIHEGKSAFTSGEEGYKSLQIIMGILQSSESGRPINF